uniref:AP-1 complex subunit sigma-2 n=1 Tax=Salmo salar TaxID=8030 RepID=B9EQC0_SALSA|nr:AP-1 complex subunit sigma-2 [Salmo salar]
MPNRSFRHGSLYFTAVTDPLDNILEVQEFIYQYLTVLDKYFSHVTELDLVFNFEKATFILDEMLLGGYYQEISHKNVCKAICDQDEAQDESEPQSFLNLLEEMSLVSSSFYKKK